MRQRNSEILGDEWIALSLVESEYSGSIFPEDPIFPRDPIFPVDSRLEDSIGPADPIDPIGPGGPVDPIDPIGPGGPVDPIGPGDPIDPGDLIDPGDPINPGDPIGSGNPINPGDPIGSGNPINPGDPIGSGNPTGSDPLTGTPSTVTRLSNPEFRILIDTTRPNEYKVEGKVTVEISEDDMDVFNTFNIRLQSTLWGEDSGWNEEDDLFSFPSTRLKLPGTYTFSAYVHRGTLNEDNTMFDKRDEVYNKFSIVSGTPFLQSPGIEIQSRTEHGYFG
jgi:hypothetical protein